ncbi:MAG: tRNA pseudouridine(55) synthase TruB [bacterium]|nr:tRNA pseudouridine(55) synthase TruB [bacterium]
MFGFLNIYKPKGKTSHDVVSVLRKITKIKQIGHTGTLEAFEEGVLPICIGKATRLIEYLDDNKAYEGIIQLGSSTDTYDTEGSILKTSDQQVTFDEIKEKITLFKGEIEQLPPIYSAIKVNGKKLYEYARQGEEVEIKPRRVNIHTFEILNYDKDTHQIEFHIECSKGTYIRSIANDLGEKLGTYGHLIKLVRVKAGKFEIENTTRLEDLLTIEDVEKKIINPLTSLDYPKYEATDRELHLLSNGMRISVDITDGISIITNNNRIIAIGNTINNKFKPNKVFI